VHAQLTATPAPCARRHACACTSLQQSPFACSWTELAVTRRGARRRSRAYRRPTRRPTFAAAGCDAGQQPNLGCACAAGRFKLCPLGSQRRCRCWRCLAGAPSTGREHWRWRGRHLGDAAVAWHVPHARHAPRLPGGYDHGCGGVCAAARAHGRGKRGWQQTARQLHGTHRLAAARPGARHLPLAGGCVEHRTLPQQPAFGTDRSAA
jgi:hypothetical protein